MSEILGIDVSQYQGQMDWDKAKSAGVRFAFIRCAFGYVLDKQFKRNWQEAKRVGIPRGAYGWCLDGYNQVSLATYFWEQIKDDPGELPPVVDFEKYGATWVGFAALQQNIETLEKLCGRAPIIYSSYGYWTSLRDYKNQFWALKYPYWHAQYTTAATPKIPAPFTDWTFWQFSADGNKRGSEFGAESQSIDIDRYNGGEKEFSEFIGASESGETEPTPINEDKAIATLSERVSRLEKWARELAYKDNKI